MTMKILFSTAGRRNWPRNRTRTLSSTVNRKPWIIKLNQSNKASWWKRSRRQMKGKMKICCMVFTLRETNFFIYRVSFLRAKPARCHMATGVIIWMLWCTSTAKSVLWAWILWVGDTWNALHEYEFLTVLCIYKQLDLVPENSPVIAVPITLSVSTTGTYVRGEWHE